MNFQVAEWATRAFFLYGGEPRLFYPGGAGMAPMPTAADFARSMSAFQPHLASTPTQSPFGTPGGHGGHPHHHPQFGAQQQPASFYNRFQGCVNVSQVEFTQLLQ